MSQKPISRAQKGRGDAFQFEQGKAEQPASPAPWPSRPNLVDYSLLLLGFGLSAYLTRIGPLPVEAKEFVADARLRTAISYLPDLMRLPEGVILLGPLFLAFQFLLGRKRGLTSVGWLWVLSWLGVVFLSVLTAWKNGVGFADPVGSYIALIPRLWYIILVPSMAALALLLWPVGLFSREPAPWTHSFGLALLVWPVLPLAAILAMASFKVG